MTKAEIVVLMRTDPAFRHQGCVVWRNGRPRLRWRERRPDGSIRQRSIAIRDPGIAAAVRQELERIRRPLRMAQLSRRLHRQFRSRVTALRRSVMDRVEGFDYRRKVSRAFSLADKLGALDLFLQLEPWTLEPRPRGRPRSKRTA